MSIPPIIQCLANARIGLARHVHEHFRCGRARRSDEKSGTDIRKQGGFAAVQLERGQDPAKEEFEKFKCETAAGGCGEELSLKEGRVREGRKAETGREKGHQILKLVKPMVDRKTSNDWNDMRALMTEAHKLAVDMNLSSNEFTFETVDIDQIQSNIMIKKIVNDDNSRPGYYPADSLLLESEHDEARNLNSRKIASPQRYKGHTRRPLQSMHSFP
jgi:hypothetical protein